MRARKNFSVETPIINQGGHPSLYKPSFCDKADEYIQQCQDSYEEFHKTRGKDSDTFERIPTVQLPKFEGFARFIGVSYDTLMEWQRIYPDFKVAMGRIKELQKERLMDKGLAGTYNSTIAKLILSANHGVNEKTESTVTMLPQPILDVNDNSNDSNEADKEAA